MNNCANPLRIFIHRSYTDERDVRRRELLSYKILVTYCVISGYHYCKKQNKSNFVMCRGVNVSYLKSFIHIWKVDGIPS